MSNGNQANVMRIIFKHEGGYVDHPRDPGSATNMGITIFTLKEWRGRDVTKAEVKALTKAEATQIYEARYWLPLNCHNLPDGWDLIAMDGGVNSGVSRGAKWLQKAVGAKADGKIGPDTLKKTILAGQPGIQKAAEIRMGFLRGLRHWGVFGKGWSRRVAETEAEATRMYLQTRHAADAGTVEGWLKGLKDAALGRSEKEKRNAGGISVGTGGGAAASWEIGWENVGLPTEILIPILVALCGFFVLRALHRSRFQRERARALEKSIQEVFK